MKHTFASKMRNIELLILSIILNFAIVGWLRYSDTRKTAQEPVLT
jgi:hypothetical protein